jgi:hypothetical protein
VSGVWLVVAAVPPYALPEPSHKEAIDDWIDLIFFVWGLSVAGVFAYLLRALSTY